VNAQSFSRKQLEVLAHAGAFDTFGYPRSVFVEAADYLMRRIQRRQEEANSGQVSLFGAATNTVADEPLKLPDLPEFSSLERLQREFSAVGFYLSAHPVDNFRDWLDKKKYVSFAEILNARPPMGAAKIAGVVVRKQEKKSERGRFAFVTMSDRSGVFDVTVYSEPLQQYRDLFTSGNLLALTVDVKWNEEEPRLILRLAQAMDNAVMNTVNNVQIKLTAQADGDKVAGYLKSIASGPIRVSVNVTLKEQKGTATIQLPQTLALRDQDMQQLRAFSGVEVIAG
jgi:DNA polymerase-3 subunit alpha